MPDRFIIRADGLSKCYRLGSMGITSFRDELGLMWQRLRGRKNVRSKHDFWALDDVSFEIREGETVGLIGRNGAGKSTLLKLLARITTPTRGRAEIDGKVAALLEVGTGFHPELSGMENIFLNGAILGMRRPEIRRKVDSIVDFAGMQQFIDTPVKRYSSGMKVRLAFAVAAHLQQEVMIVDEVLAVGDRDFQRKCISKMGEVARNGRTVIIVSHNMMTITQLSQRVMYLKDGKLESFGYADAVIRQYLGDGTVGQGEQIWPEGIADPGVDEFRLFAVRIRDGEGNVNQQFSVSDTLRFEVEFEVTTRIWGFYLRFMIRADSGVLALSMVSNEDKAFHGYLDPGRYRYCATVPPKRLNHGNYSLSLDLSAYNTKYLLRLDDQLSFDLDLISRHGEVLVHTGSIVYPDVQWDFQNRS
jgi:lipopolysaccharide transport system ATP-binding protein